MGHETEVRRPPTWWPTFADWAPVPLVALLSLTGLALEEPWSGTDLELAATSLATALPLVLRRRRPLSVTAGLAGVLVVQTTVLGESLHFGSFLACLVVVFDGARHLPLPRALAALVVVLAAMGVAQHESVVEDPVQLVYPLVYFGGIWLLGRGARTLVRQAVRLRELNEALETERENRAALAVAQERLRLAGELHDTLGHRLVLMVVQAQAAQETLDAVRASTAASLQAVQTTGREGMQDLRRLVDALHPAVHDDLAAIVTRTRGAGLDVHLDAQDVPPALADVVHRVVQESLTNVLKHSLAGRADVRVSGQGAAGEESVRVLVTDPGPPRSDTSSGRRGHGLSGMQRRVAGAGGSLATGPRGDGYRVEAVLPVVR
jgi:signal transduction histidine kinase